jgi:phenylacetate-CoA ligase
MIFKLTIYYLSLILWQFAPIGLVKRMQLRKFRKMFEYAKQNSDFYREYYRQHGVADLKIKNFDDIQKVPIIKKSILRKYPIEDIMTCGLTDDIDIHSTSGSSGDPFKLACTKFENFTAHVRFTKALMGHGYNPFKKMVVISRYGENHTFQIEKDSNLLSSLKKKIKIFPREVVSIFEPIDKIIEKIQKAKPYVVWSTPSIIHLIAVELQKRNQALDIPLCVTMAETISNNDLDLFKRRICKNLIDTYGCMESPSMGFSFNSLEYKDIIAASSLVEVTNERKLNGEAVGDIIVTNLVSKTMPIIRYDLEDYVGVLEDQKFPNLKIGRVYGRFDDVFYFGNNHTFAFHQSYQLFRDFHECEKYKFVQMTDGSIILQLKVFPGAKKELVKQKALQLWNSYYPDFPITIEWKDNFERDPKSGKFKVMEKLNK